MGELLDFFTHDFDRIEASLRQRFESENPFINEVCGHILFAGGKRIRPLLTVCAARLCNCSDGRAYELSAVPEYLHAASLLHDDVVDGGILRRGRPAAYTIWGNKAVVLVGDFLYARAIELATRFDNVPIARTIAETVALMSEGEIIQLLKAKAGSLDEKTYMDIIHRKTGALISASCAIGAHLAGADKTKVDALSEFGRLIGLAFQMVDDVLDYASDPQDLGKAVGTDLAEGKTTLPLLIAMERSGAGDRSRITRILASEEASDDDHAWVHDLLAGTGALDDTRKRAQTYIEEACGRISIFEPTETRDRLMGLARYILERKK